jgi:hypothetical protein
LIQPVLASLWTSIRTWWSGIDWGQLGRDIISGIVSGVTNGASAVGDAVRGIAAGATTAFKNALGIQSPSKLFMQFGEQIAEGLSIGINSGEGRVSSSGMNLGAAAFAGAAGATNNSQSTTIHIDARGAGNGVADGLESMIRRILNEEGRAADALIRTQR